VVTSKALAFISIKVAKAPVEIAFAVGVHDMNLLPERTRGFFHVFRLGLSIRKIRIHEHPDYGDVWD
jgi:hypothetical protein